MDRTREEEGVTRLFPPVPLMVCGLVHLELVARPQDRLQCTRLSSPSGGAALPSKRTKISEHGKDSNGDEPSRAGGSGPRVLAPADARGASG